MYTLQAQTASHSGFMQAWKKAVTRKCAMLEIRVQVLHQMGYLKMLVAELATLPLLVLT